MVQMISDIHPLILDGFILTDLSKSWFSLKITGVLLHFVESHQTGQFFLQCTKIKYVNIDPGKFFQVHLC